MNIMIWQDVILMSTHTLQFGNVIFGRDFTVKYSITVKLVRYARKLRIILTHRNHHWGCGQKQKYGREYILTCWGHYLRRKKGINTFYWWSMHSVNGLKHSN